jgi:hypothetical protein
LAGVKDRPDDRSPTAAAYSWASRILSVSWEMVVPGLIGVWLDQRLGTVCAFTMLGFVGGMTYGLWHLIRISTPSKDDRGDGGESRHGSDR